MKVTKKDNHDTMWVKATDENKKWFKVTVGHGGVMLKSNMPKAKAVKLSNVFKGEHAKFKADKLTYGQLVENTEVAFKQIA